VANNDSNVYVEANIKGITVNCLLDSFTKGMSVCSHPESSRQSTVIPSLLALTYTLPSLLLTLTLVFCFVNVVLLLLAEDNFVYDVLVHHTDNSEHDQLKVPVVP